MALSWTVIMMVKQQEVNIENLKNKIMEKSNYQQYQGFNAIENDELVKIKAGFAFLPFAALAVTVGKLILDSSYYIGYAVGYNE
jgi:hypothetical protein